MSSFCEPRTGGRLNETFSGAVVSKNIATSSADAMLGYYRMWVSEDFSAEVIAAKIETPILVISGDRDLPGFQADVYQETFGQWYPRNEITSIADAGHLPMYETPAYLAAIVERFLERQAEAA